MWQIGGMILLALSAWGYVALHDAKQREIGAAKVKTRLAEERAAVEADIARANQEGKLKFAALYEAAMRRNREAEAKIATDALTREAANEAQARKDAAYADWRERPVPEYVVGRLRDATFLTTDEQNSGQLPTRVAVSVDPLVSPDSTGATESMVGRLLRIFGAAVAPRVEKSRPGAQ